MVTVPTITGGAATPFILTPGAGGTQVAKGSQLQLQGGIAVVGEPIILSGKGNPLQTEVQSVNISAPVYGSFQLTFTNPNPTVQLTSTTTSIPVGASAAQVEAALNGLASIQAGSGQVGAEPGRVTVTRNGLNTYLVVFQGGFFGGSQPWSKQTIAVTGTSGTFDLHFTGYAPSATVTVGATPAVTLANLQSALNAILADLDAPGGGTGTVSVASTSTGYLLTFGGSLKDVAVPVLLATNFTGAPLPGVAIGQQAWLVATPAKQLVSTSGPGGTFTLGFTGFLPTATVTVGANAAATRASLQTALNTLLGNASSPGGGTGTATVDATATGNFVITFGGSLVSATPPKLVAGSFTGPAGASILQLGSTGTVAEVIQGGTTNKTPTQWFSSGPSPVGNAEVNLEAATSNADISGSITSVVTDPSDPSIIFISTAGGGGRPDDGGRTWAPSSTASRRCNPSTLTRRSNTDVYTLTFTDPFTEFSNDYAVAPSRPACESRPP